MRICLCHHLSLSYLGGGEKFIVSLAKELVKRDHNVEIYGMPFLGKNGGLVNFKDLLEGIPYEEVIRHKVSCDVCYMMYRPLILHNFKSKSPKIAGIHTELFWQKKLQLSYGTLASLFYLFNKVYHLADLRQFDAVHSITSAYPINHPHVYFIHNFVDSQFYVPKNNKEDKFTVTYASRMVWQKGWDKFQQIAKQLEQYDINVKVSSGKVQESDMPSFLSSAHVVVVPSRVDTFGILIVEALMTGTFVITTSLKTHQFLELPLIYADSVEENVAQIIRLKELWESNKEKYYELATLGRTSALKYDKKVIVDKLEKMFSEVASNTHQNSEFTEM